MNVRRGAALIILSTVLMGLCGLGIGASMGILMPDYYRAMFRPGSIPPLDPVQVGAGLGLSQGLIGGLIIGCVLTISVAWYESRSTRRD